MIFSKKKSVPILYIPKCVSRFDTYEIKKEYSKFWLGDSIRLKSKSYFTNIHVCCYKGNNTFDIEKGIIKFSEKWSIKVSAYYEFNDDDFIWVQFQTGSENRKFVMKPTDGVNISYRSNGTDLYIIAWDHRESIITPDKIYDFISNERMEDHMNKTIETIGQYLQRPREDLQFVCNDNIPGVNMHMTIGGYEISCADVDYMKFYITDGYHPIVVRSHKCTLLADRLIDDHSTNNIYILPPYHNIIRFNQETKFDKIFVKVIKEHNVLNVILSADPNNFIEPSIDQYEGFVDPEKLVNIDMICDYDSYKYLKFDSFTIKSVKFEIVDNDIKKIQFRKPGFMKYSISIDSHSSIVITTKRYSDNEVFLTASINGQPQSFMQRLDNKTTNVNIRVARKKDTIKFILNEVEK